jgi:AAA domain
VVIGDADHFPLTTREGWQQFVDAEPAEPKLLPGSDLDLLGDADRMAYDHARADYHSRLIVVATPTIKQVYATGRRLVLLNRHQISARRGLIVTGPAGTGKTTAVTQLGRNHELLLWHRLGHQAVAGRMPVVYVTVPPAATPKMLASEFARFAGVPVHRGQNQADITNAVCDVLARLRADLVLVDEIHNLNLATRAGADASDQLKYLAERIPATFIYAGINAEGSGLFAGTRGQQIAGRFGVITCQAFPYGTATQRQQWQALIATLEQSLRLHRHQPGQLLRLDAYLHERTDGMIGSLSHLIRGAAVEAILDGTEKITRETLDRIGLDHAAETTRTRRKAAARRGHASAG